MMFQADDNKGTIFRYSAIVAIMIACLGLFGLASFMVEQRRKEVGIRKVLGASVSGVTIMLSKEFMRWIVIANLIAAPVAYVFMEKILTNYAYRISVDWWMYAATAGLTLVIALFTVGYQSVKTALVNPAECLRYE
jgi:putative ABC transport system permease protein